MATICDTKKCFKCGEVKPLEDFYVHPQMGDGRLNKCKTCNKRDVKENYERKICDPGYRDQERKRGRDKYRRLYVGTGVAKPECNRRWAERYPEKQAAQGACNSLKKPFEKAEGHHWSYNQEHFKDVIWMIKKHHMKAHRFIKYDQEFKMYRRKDTNELLDTKAKHERFIIEQIFYQED